MSKKTKEITTIDEKDSFRELMEYALTSQHDPVLSWYLALFALHGPELHIEQLASKYNWTPGFADKVFTTAHSYAVTKTYFKCTRHNALVITLVNKSLLG